METNKKTINFVKGQLFQLENLEVKIIGLVSANNEVVYKCESYKNDRLYSTCNYKQEFLKTLKYIN